jgi:hypothetical protein
MADEARSAGRLQGGAPKKGIAIIATATSVPWYSLIKILSDAFELRPVIEQYLSTVTDGKLKRHMATALRTQSHLLIGLE